MLLKYNIYYMITNFKIFNETVEVTPNNTSGHAGDTSSRRDPDGFIKTGNDGGFGVGFGRSITYGEG